MDPAVEQSPPASALEELATDASSRKRFLRMAGGGAVAASLSALIAACGDDDEAGNAFGGAGVGTERFGQGDVGIVGYALYLETLEVAFYNDAIDSGKVTGRALELFERFRDAEVAHSLTLANTYDQLGAGKLPPGKFSFPLESGDQILATAAEIESLGAKAYLGQVGRIQAKPVLAAALAIHTVESRHAAALAQLLGQPIAPDGSFAAPATSVEVLRQITPFLA